MKIPLIILTALLTHFPMALDQTQDTLTEGDYALLSHLIDRMAFPIPPPPPIGSTDTVPSQELVDSLSKVKLVVGIYPVVKNVPSSKKSKDYIKKCSDEMMNPTKKVAFTLDLERLKSRRGHQIKLLDTTMDRNLIYAQHDLIIHFSRPIYNGDHSRAFLEISEGRGRLNGYSVAVCLQKEKEFWKVVNSVELSIW